MASKHTHQYRRIKQPPSNRIIYRCMRPDCNHYLTPEFILGKASVCWQCKTDFVMDPYSTERQFPKCKDCRTKVTSFSIAKQERLLKLSTTGPKPVSNSENESQPDVASPVADILKRYGL